MLNPETRSRIVSYYRNGKKMGDIYPTVCPQAISKRPMSWVERVAYGLGAQDFHFDQRVGLSIAFPEFNPIQLEDHSTALGYEMWMFGYNFTRDTFRKPTEEIVNRAKAGFKYSVAVTVVKNFKHTLREEQIPDPEARAFRYFREMLLGDKDPVDILASLFNDGLFVDNEEATLALESCRRILQIKAEAGASIKGYSQPKDRYLTKDEVASTISLLLREAKEYSKAGAAVIV